MVFENNQRESSPRFPGLYVGQVMDVATYAKSGQIKVSIPSIFDPPTPDNWVSAKLCFLFGHFFIPEVGSQVWLAFENGDPRSPVCLGVSYPATETATTPISSGMIKTFLGHSISFDKEGSITIQTQPPSTTVELTADGAKVSSGTTNIEITSQGVTVNAGIGTVNINTTSPSSIKLGGEDATQPALRLNDLFVGNLGAPVAVTPVPPTRKVFVA